MRKHISDTHTIRWEILYYVTAYTRSLAVRARRQAAAAVWSG